MHLHRTTDQRTEPTNPGPRGACYAHAVPACPGEAELCEFVDGDASPTSHERVVEHLDACGECRQLVAALAKGDATQTTAVMSEELDPTLPKTVRPGARWGRYVVLEQIGRGGMGVVYSAYDTTLDRKVALKRIGSSAIGRAGLEQRTRHLREAQGIAQVSHPNVVSVFDVSVHGDDVMIAMELISGRTLREWLRAERPSWRRTLSVMIAAGRGLAAAHDAGLVHRDFKPDNVLIDDGGRPRVVDFGLVRSESTSLPSRSDVHRELAAAEAGPESSSPRTDPFAAAVTRLGDRVGTPAYMAPEQHEGEVVDARADQFAFCVTLYESLYGERPFAGRTQAEIAQAMVSQRPTLPARAPHVPAWLRRVILRGLAPRSVDRWPSMNALLEALEHIPARRRWLLLGTGTVVLSITSFLVGAERTERPCDGGTRLLAPIWGERRDAVHQAFIASGSALAGDAFARTAPLLDAWVERWSTTWQVVCEAERAQRSSAQDAHGSRSTRMACLADGRRALDGLVRALLEPDVDVVHASVAAASSLPAPVDCETAVTRPPVPADAQSAQAAEALRDDLARVRGLDEVGRHADALTLAEDVFTAAEALGHPPTTAQARLHLGHARVRVGDLRVGSADLAEAFFSARSTGHEAVARQSALELAVVEGRDLGRVEVGRLWARHAIAGETPVSRELVVRQLDALGMIAERAGEFEVAREAFAQAVAEAQTHAPTLLTVQLEHLGVALAQLGRFDEAETLLRRVLARRTEVLGPRHPEVGLTLANLATVLASQGEREQVVALYEEAHAILLAAFGPDSPRIADSHNNYGIVLRDIGRADEAIEHFERAYALRAETAPPGDPHLVLALSNLGTTFAALHRFDEGRSTMLDALRLARSGSEHPAEGHVLHSLGLLLWLSGELDEAQTQLHAAIDVWTSRLGLEHPNTRVAMATACGLWLEHAAPGEDVAPSCSGPLGELSPGPVVTALLAAHRGDPTAARDLIEGTRSDGEIVEHRLRLTLARTLARRGDLQGAHDQALIAARAYERLGAPWVAEAKAARAQAAALAAR
jgi:eukaryotic-like serine/threonine-protein kinase